MMKKKIVVLITFLFMAIGIDAQKNLLPNIKADISHMNPIKYEPQHGLTGFSLELKNDSAYVYLPYMGEVYNPVYGGGGLNFNEPCTKISVKKTKKGDGRILSFDVKHESVNYKFFMTVYDNKSMDLDMQPSNAQSCNYSGEWE